MRKWLKWICIICLIPIVLFLVVSALFYIPAVQNAAVKAGADYFSDKLGMKVGLEKVRLAFPLNFSAQNAYAVSAENDTLLILNKLTAEVRLRPLWDGNISVKGVTLKNLKLNSAKLIDNMLIKGNIGEVRLRADSILLEKERVLINLFSLQNADIELFYCDTTVKDTSKTPINWLIELQKIDFQNVSFSCRMPCDSLNMDVQIAKASLSDGLVNLGENKYDVLSFNTAIDSLFYGKDLEASKVGFDPAHIRLSDLQLALKSLHFAGLYDFGVLLQEFSAKEPSGLTVKSTEGNITSDSSNISIRSLQMKTGNSEMNLEALIPWKIMENQSTGDAMSLDFNAIIDRRDVLFFIPDNLPDFRALYPDKDLTVSILADGYLNNLTVGKFSVEMPSHIQMDVKGNLRNVLKDSIRAGNLDLRANSGNLVFLMKMMPKEMQEQFKIPENVRLNGNLNMNRGQYAVDLNFWENKGEVCLSGKYNVFTTAYDISVSVDSLQPVNFMPKDSLMLLNGSLYAVGRGTDIFHERTFAEVRANITDIQYANYYFTDLSLNGILQDNRLKAEFTSDYPLATGNIAFDGTIRKDSVKGLLTANMDTLDLQGLNFSDSTFATSFRLIADFETNLKRKHSLDMSLDDWFLTMEKQQTHPAPMTLAFRSEEDTVKIDFNTGDLNLSVTGNADPMTLANRFIKLSKEVMNQLKRDSLVDMQALRPDFPDMTLYISAENNNPLYNFLQEYGIFYENFSIEASISPEAGLSADGILLALVKDTFKIDTVQFTIWQDTLGLRYRADVQKNRFRNQNPFKASAYGYLYNREADLFLSFINRYGEKGVDLGINLKKASKGFDFHLYPEKVVLAFIPFTLNENNYFYLNNREMEADLYLKGNDNASFWVHSDTLQEAKELLVELNQINIEKMTAGFSDYQPFKGILNATLRYEPTEKSYMIMADGNVDSLYYENGRIGEILLNATYMPVTNTQHQIDLHAFRDLNEIVSLSLLYTQARNEGKLDGILNISRLPLKMVEPFVPDDMAKLNGFINGNFDITGTTAKPVVGGSLQSDSMSIFVIPSSTNLRIDNKEITMKNNILNIDNFKVFVQENPFVVNGNINAANLNNPYVNINISGNNVPLINAKNTPGNMVYGKLYVNLNTSVTGAMQSLRTRGNLSISGNSNLTYVMPDATLEAQDGFNNIVRFTYFADTLPRVNRQPGSFRRRGSASISGNDVFLTIHIDPVAWFNIDMDAEKKNYVELKGGGDLTFQYTPQGDMQLNGRYSLSNGNIRYNIPVIPLTDFTVRNGSYVDWSGDPMNPYLNMTAYSKIRSTVKFDGQSRMVDFNAGIRINNYLDQMNLEFILEAPNDVNVQNQLAAMGGEERSKQAISLLVTGVYLASGGTGTDHLDMNAALSSFLQRELKNIIGSFLEEVPFTFDILTYDGLFGVSRRIDYIGRLHTSFINNRLSSTIGLRYATNDPLYGDRLLIDDITFDYNLETDGSRSISLFRNKEYKNIFESEIDRIGAGFTIRRKVKRLGDLFKMPKKQDPE
ncbi:MAG: translocation/assembly module TamB [Tannerella sp.]|jgi:hypothetical protein|nr:translocation/assembly module TamB [Tannerella sp.]